MVKLRIHTYEDVVKPVEPLYNSAVKRYANKLPELPIRTEKYLTTFLYYCFIETALKKVREEMEILKNKIAACEEEIRDLHEFDVKLVYSYMERVLDDGWTFRKKA